MKEYDPRQFLSSPPPPPLPLPRNSNPPPTRQVTPTNSTRSLPSSFSLSTPSSPAPPPPSNHPPPSETDTPLHHPDLDILEVEERMRFVEQTWDLYAHGAWARLPKFFSLLGTTTPPEGTPCPRSPGCP